MGLLHLPFPSPGSSKVSAPSGGGGGGGGGIPVNEYVFGSDETTGLQCLTMSDSDWSYSEDPDMSEFGILARVKLGATFASGERWIWNDYETGTQKSFYFGRMRSDGYFQCRTLSGSGAGMFSIADFMPTLVAAETLIYWYVIDGTMRLYWGQGDDALTLAQTSSGIGTPYEGEGQIGFGAKNETTYGWHGTIHQPCFFTKNNGADIPTETEVGTASTPVDLSDHAALFSAPDADNASPNIDLVHPQAWTNVNTLSVQVRGG